MKGYDESHGTTTQCWQAMTPEDYLKRPYTRCYVPDGEGGYTFFMLEFPGCIIKVERDPIDDAALEYGEILLEQAALEWIAAALDLGQEIPEPEEER